MVTPNEQPNGSARVSIFIMMLFLTTIVGILVLKWHAPDTTDVTFIGVVVGMVMTMAGFIVTHLRLEKIPTKEDTKQVADNLQATVKAAAAKVSMESSIKLNEQTETITKKIEEAKP